jgi:hypothetical protein
MGMGRTIRGFSSDDDSSAPALEYEGIPPDHMLGSPVLPSEGSKAHYLGECKPCAFLYKDGCKSEKGCNFCHLCTPGEKKRRKKEKHTIVRAMRQLRAANWSSYMGPQLLPQIVHM